jgi:GDPmannose 4,6-dehydratase
MLLGDAKKAKEKLNWKTKISFDQLIEEMINYDLKNAQNEKLIKNNTNL